MQARDVMSVDLQVVTPAKYVMRAAQMMRDYNVGLIPVVATHATSRLVGVITDRDIAVRCMARGVGGSVALVGDHMTEEPIYTVRPEEDVGHVMDLMEEHQVRRIPVVTAEGELVGIIAGADLARTLGRRRPLELERVIDMISAPHPPHVAVP